MSESRPESTAGRSADALAELFDDLAARIQAGEVLDWEAITREHPGHVEELRELLRPLAALRDLSGPAADADDAPAPLGTLGDFRLLRELGRGGMGIVYEAEQLSLGRNVALKVLPSAGALDPRHLQRFKNEARAAAGLHHPHIVPVHAVGSDRGVHFIAMQLVDGMTLAQLTPDHRGRADRSQPAGDPTVPYRSAAPAAETAPVAALTTDPDGRKGAGFYRQAARLTAEAADALEYAHSAGVVHRDVKPGNLMVDRSGKLWVTDFGLAKLQADAALTVSGDLLGTLRYMSPEQAMARHGLVDHRTDVYALGATLYELMTGRPAVDGADRQELLRAVAFEDPVAPRKLDWSIPAELETVCLKCLSKNPAERYQTAGELAEDLRRWLGHQTIRAKPPTLRQRVGKWAFRHQTLVRAATAVGLVAAVAVAVIAGLVWRQNDRLAAANAGTTNALVEERRQRGLAEANEQRALKEKGIADAVRSFLQTKLLLQADPTQQADTVRALGGQFVATENPTVKELLDRAAVVLAPDKIEEQFPGQPEVQAEVLRTVGTAYRAVGAYGKAIELLTRAADTSRRALGADHQNTLAYLNDLAVALLWAGKLPEATALFEKVRDSLGKTLGTDHPDTLAVQDNVGVAYMDVGKFQEAIALLEMVRDAKAAKLGTEHPSILFTLHSLAGAYRDAGRLPESIELFERLRDTRSATLGTDHPDTLTTLNDLANAYGAAGRVSEAIGLSERVRDASMAIFGAEQPDGSVVVAGVTSPSAAGGDLALARFTPAGMPDPTFGDGGLAVFDSGDPRSVAIQPSDGRIVVAGIDGSSALVARFLPNGSIDASFGTGGIALNAFTNKNSSLNDVALQPDGRIVAVGGATTQVNKNASQTNFLVARLLGDGAPALSPASFSLASPGTARELLGHDHDEGGAMAEALAPGVRTAVSPVPVSWPPAPADTPARPGTRPPAAGELRRYHERTAEANLDLPLWGVELDPASS